MGILGRKVSVIILGTPKDYRCAGQDAGQDLYLAHGKWTHERPWTPERPAGHPLVLICLYSQGFRANHWSGKDVFAFAGFAKANTSRCASIYNMFVYANMQTYASMGYG